MPSCREVTRLAAGDQLPRAGWLVQGMVRVHLLWCGHCRKYVAQLRMIGRAARQLIQGDTDTAAAAARIMSRLAAERKQSP